jgi:hypothetical protein
MTPDQLPENPTLPQVADALKKVMEQLRRNNRLRNVALFTACITLLVAGITAGYALHSEETRNAAEKAALAAEVALKKELHTNRVFACNQARSIAVAFREPQISREGTPESTGHYIARMLAQRAQLGESKNLRCSLLPEFGVFPFLRARALHEIEVILHEEAPTRFPPPRPGRKRLTASPAPAPARPSGPVAANTSPAASTPRSPPIAHPHHATHVSSSTPPKQEGDGHSHTGSPATTPKGSPPVPEPTSPATASPAEAGNEAVAPAGTNTIEKTVESTHETSETTTPAAPQEPLHEIGETAGEVVGSAEGLLCNLLCPTSPTTP